MNIWIFLLIFGIIFTILNVAYIEFFSNDLPVKNNEKKSKYTIKELSTASYLTLEYAKKYYKTDRIAMLSISDTHVNHKYINFKCKLYNYKKMNIMNVDVNILKPFGFRSL